MTTPILFVLEGYSSHAYPATLALTDILANSSRSNTSITNRTDEQRQCDQSQARLPSSPLTLSGAYHKPAFSRFIATRRADTHRPQQSYPW
jgi:hypothetical protein